MGCITIATASLLIIGVSVANRTDVRQKHTIHANEDWSPIQVLIFECGVDVCDTGVHFCDHSQTYRTCVPCARVSHHCFSVHQQYNCTSYCMDHWRKKQSTKCIATQAQDLFMWPFILCAIVLLISVGLLIASLKGMIPPNSYNVCCPSKNIDSQNNVEQRSNCDGQAAENERMIGPTDGQIEGSPANNVANRVSNNPIHNCDIQPDFGSDEHGVPNGGYQSSQRTVGTSTISHSPPNQRSQPMVFCRCHRRAFPVDQDMYLNDNQMPDELLNALINLIKTNGNTILKTLANDTGPRRELSKPVSTEGADHGIFHPDDTFNKRPI
ncbi:uncharacterized protein LOC127870434 [Dreissena polymorpha]|uniref:Uncharacterized protein n=1 Tax=Dreissena polymorpha TaxID=45954 RepID=A0A9D4MBT0_DREPO|nr:uncharacterized protein LOC127870434 [Dreissena polymorpha]KAH3873355.1 hypothetical protein DPMN_036589 [Dreissena polymorpha]